MYREAPLRQRCEGWCGKEHLAAELQDMPYDGAVRRLCSACVAEARTHENGRVAFIVVVAVVVGGVLLLCLLGYATSGLKLMTP